MSRLQRVGFLADLHVPYHSVEAVKTAITALKEMKGDAGHRERGIDTLVLLGDFIDCYPVSSFPKNPARRGDLKFEIEAGRDKLKELVRAFPRSRRIYIFGNHEDRLRSHIWSEAPALGSLVTLDDLLDLKKDSWECVPYGKHIRLGKLTCTHGHATNANHASKMLADYGHSVIYGHMHTIQSSIRVNALKEEQIGLCVPWLGDLAEIEYTNRIPQWTLGYATAYVRDDGAFWANSHRIHNAATVNEGSYYTRLGKGWTVPKKGEPMFTLDEPAASGGGIDKSKDRS